MKALLFGGTFGPPHAGHMNNLRAAMQAVQPDVVLVMPAGIPPHKHASATPGELRLAMCECFKALGPQVQVSQWEVDRAGRSYTYNTVSMLQEKYPGAQLYMTIGSDMLETFDEWYRWREILAMVTLVVQSREPGDGDALRAAAQKLEEAGGKIMFADAPVLECASSDIRAGKYPPARLKELLPPPVALVMVTDPTKATLPVGLANLYEIQRYATDWGALFAALVLALIPTVILFIVGQKQLVQGLSVGGVKG